MALPMRPTENMLDSYFNLGRRIRQAHHSDSNEDTPFAPNWVAPKPITAPTMALSKPFRTRLVLSHVENQATPDCTYRVSARTDAGTKATTSEGDVPISLDEFVMKKHKHDYSDLRVQVMRGQLDCGSVDVPFKSLLLALATYTPIPLFNGTTVLTWQDIRTILVGFYAPAIREPNGMMTVIQSEAFSHGGIEVLRVPYNATGHKRTVAQITLWIGNVKSVVTNIPALVWGEAAQIVWKSLSTMPPKR